MRWIFLTFLLFLSSCTFGVNTVYNNNGTIGSKDSYITFGPVIRSAKYNLPLCEDPGNKCIKDKDIQLIPREE